ncbi:hypothetical protein [Streptomyces sp. NPDC093109]|uniref:hypothetical protein n=1 Tax=Streptomyces sp. NPDC093109 TaxID=3154977 RepID=UPI00344B59D6
MATTRDNTSGSVNVKDNDIPVPSIATWMLDTERGAVGEVVGYVVARVRLRHPRGGDEWEADPGCLRPATPAEELRARVAARNHRTRL